MRQLRQSLYSTAWLSTVLMLALVVLTGSASAASSAPTRRAAKFEIKFIKNMIDHHAMAVEMATLCGDRAVHSDLDIQCQIIIADQTAEIQKMQEWLRDWYGVSYEPRMNGQMRKEVSELSSLTGAEFEMTFMMMMIEHHAIAIQKAAECLGEASHDELTKVCAKIIQSQSKEIGLMQGWLCEWYGICPG